LASNLGFPRIGHRRELKIALEKFWAGETNEAALQATAAALRTRHWKLQSGLGISHVPSGETAERNCGRATSACMAWPFNWAWRSLFRSAANHSGHRKSWRLSADITSIAVGAPARP